MTDVIQLCLTPAGMPIRTEIVVIETDIQRYVLSELAVGMIA